MGRLDNKVAIITGGANGMGLAAVELFAREGASVMATDVVDTLQSAVADLDGEITSMKQDVSSPDDWKKVVDETVKKYGKIDILVNNAGVHLAKGVIETSMEEWNRVMNINTTGVWLGMKEVIPHMEKNGGGSIVNCASIAAIVGGPGDGNGAAYSASKGAVRSLTKHVAQWWGENANIRCNSVHPGAIFTNMARQASNCKTPEEMGAYSKGLSALKPYAGEAMDIAYGYLYLASDESKYVTGEELVIDGGWITR